MNPPRAAWLCASAIALVGVACLATYLPRRLAAAAEAVSVESLEGVPHRPASPRHLTVAAYNIAHGRGGDMGASNWGGRVDERIERLRAMGRLLDAHGAQIVVLNEVDFDCTWSGRVDQAEIVARAGGYPFVVRQRSFAVVTPPFRAVFGNAILSRLPIVDARLEAFEPYSRFQGWLAGNHDSVLARIELPSGIELSLWAVHLEVRSVEVRLEAARRVLDRAREIPGPLVVAGDLNSRLDLAALRDATASPPSAINRLLASRVFSSFPPVDETASYPTFPSATPDRTIDWILFPADWELLRGEAPRARHSDHLPVFARLGFGHTAPAER